MAGLSTLAKAPIYLFSPCAATVLSSWTETRVHSEVSADLPRAQLRTRGAEGEVLCGARVAIAWAQTRAPVGKVKKTPFCFCRPL